MSSSMRNKKRQHTAVLAAVAAQQPENIERRAQVRIEGLEKTLADLEWTKKRCANDLFHANRRISELSKLVKRQRNDILILIGGYVLTVGAYALSIYLK